MKSLGNSECTVRSGYYERNVQICGGVSGLFSDWPIC